MEKQTSSITLEASLENLGTTNSFIHKWAKKASLSTHSENELLLAAEEVYINIVRYAYPESLGKVTIHCRIDEDSLVLKIKDEGIPFNPLQLPEPHLVSCLKERKVGGLGVFLMRRFADNVKYEKQGKYNVLTLVKSKKRDTKYQEGESRENRGS
jgi:anti-sigma regulatory factor (Ser/Thr protein kinase)